MIKTFYALSKDNEPLENHLKNVSELARTFTNEFGAGDWGYLAGLWHDLGKYSVSSTKRTVRRV